MHTQLRATVTHLTSPDSINQMIITVIETNYPIVYAHAMDGVVRAGPHGAEDDPALGRGRLTG